MEISCRLHQCYIVFDQANYDVLAGKVTILVLWFKVKAVLFTSLSTAI